MVLNIESPTEKSVLGEMMMVGAAERWRMCKKIKKKKNLPPTSGTGRTRSPSVTLSAPSWVTSRSHSWKDLRKEPGIHLLPEHHEWWIPDLVQDCLNVSGLQWVVEHHPELVNIEILQCLNAQGAGGSCACAAKEKQNSEQHSSKCRI